MNANYLLIGGGLASHNAAKAIRELDPQGTILIVGGEPQRPYNRPPLSKDYMQGKTTAEKILAVAPEFYTEHRIDLLLETTVDRLDAQSKTAYLSNGQSVTYGKALLATGGQPVKLDIPGIEGPNVFYLRSLNDATAISKVAREGTRVAIIGGGFIGVELAASLTQRGVHATVIYSGPHLWSRFADERLAGYIQDHCEARGVRFVPDDKASAIQGEGKSTTVVTASGVRVECDFVVVAVGIIPNVELAKGAGLKVDNGVVVDNLLCTTDDDVYAAGDLCNYPDPYFDHRRRVEHWGQADYTGMLAGQNMAGANNRYDLLTYVFSDIFDLHLEFAGDEHLFDRTLLRGRMEDNCFSVLYLKNNLLTAHFSINVKRKQYAPLEELIKARVDLAGKEPQLEDMNFLLEKLLPQVSASK